MLFCHLFIIVRQHQNSLQHYLMFLGVINVPSFETCFNMVKNGKIQLKIGQFAVKYHVFVIVLQKICSYILNKLQLMSVTVFTFLRVQHLFFEGKKKMVKHLIIKIRRIYFKKCLKTSACFMIFNIPCTAF